MTSAMATSRFSTGLQFSRKDLQSLSRDTDGGEEDGDKACLDVGDLCLSPLSEEEQLLRRAAHLRRSIVAELQPRLDAADDTLRNRQRQLAALRQQLPSPAFSWFQRTCEVLRRRLALFEEVTVLRLVKEAAETSGCAASQTARWCKSNQWPALTTFVGLQLYVTLTAANAARYSPDPLSKSSNAVIATTWAVQKRLAALWCEWQRSPPCHSFLERFYLLKDVLYGWERGWCLRPPCSEQETASRTHEESLAKACPWRQWEDLSNLERVLSFDAMCSLHLTESVVLLLERSLSLEFADVWSVVAAAV